MASIYVFPSEGSSKTIREQERGFNNVARESASDGKYAVLKAVDSVRSMRRNGNIVYEEIPVPKSSADHGIGVGLTINNDVNDLHPASGWIMLMYSEEYRSAWYGHWRCAAFCSFTMPEGDRDCLMPSLYWDSLERRLAGLDSEGTLGGTVSVGNSVGFGTMAQPANEDTRTDCEIRVSWTPLTDEENSVQDAGAQVEAWAAFMASCATYEGERCIS